MLAEIHAADGEIKQRDRYRQFQHDQDELPHGE